MAIGEGTNSGTATVGMPRVNSGSLAMVLIDEVRRLGAAVDPVVGGWVRRAGHTFDPYYVLL